MKAAIFLDNWKLPVFRRNLTQAGFDYTDGGGLTVGTTILTVVTDDMDALGLIVASSAAECAGMRNG